MEGNIDNGSLWLSLENIEILSLKVFLDVGNISWVLISKLHNLSRANLRLNFVLMITLERILIYVHHPFKTYIMSIFFIQFVDEVD